MNLEGMIREGITGREEPRENDLNAGYIYAHNGYHYPLIIGG
jgi:hypothetical protein